MSDVLVPGHIRQSNLIERLFLKKRFWIIMSALLFFYPIARTVLRKLPPPLPSYGQVSAFELINEFKQPFGSENLKGKIYLANFIFSSCPTVCHENLKKIQVVQKRVRGLGKSISIVSFTVDPETDTPEKLFKLSREYQANPHIWTFLTGELPKIQTLLVDGFKVPVGTTKEEIKPNVFDIAHSSKIVLVDQNGEIRGYYSLDDQSVGRMMIDIGLLVNNAFHYES